MDEKLAELQRQLAQVQLDKVRQCGVLLCMSEEQHQLRDGSRWQPVLYPASEWLANSCWLLWLARTSAAMQLNMEFDRRCVHAG